MPETAAIDPSIPVGGREDVLSHASARARRAGAHSHTGRAPEPAERSRCASIGHPPESRGREAHRPHGSARLGVAGSSPASDPTPGARAAAPHDLRPAGVDVAVAPRAVPAPWWSGRSRWLERARASDISFVCLAKNRRERFCGSRARLASLPYHPRQDL
ncbi:unnamed protein product [Urochloa humidicola]